jgi:4-hydroxy-L-threonine phosphate dehydrogenase PdxA
MISPALAKLFNRYFIDLLGPLMADALFLTVGGKRLLSGAIACDAVKPLDCFPLRAAGGSRD